MLKLSVLSAALLAASVMVATTGVSVAGTGKYIPKGHAYSPGNENLPTFNSQRGKISNQADIYESEIYRVQRERAIHDAEMRRLIEHDLTGGTDFEPRY